MKIKEVMSENVEIAAHDKHLHEIAGQMKSRDCGCIVITKDDRLIGMITDRDIALRCVAESLDAAETTAEDMMSPKILYCMETDEVDDILNNMSENKVRRLPVLNEEKRLVGIVSLSDLVSNENHKLCGKTVENICSAA